MRLSGKKLDPWHNRKHPFRYDVEALHAMLLDDLVHHRPPGGPDEHGVAFLLGACQKVAADRHVTVNDYFEALLAQAASITGSTAVAMA